MLGSAGVGNECGGKGRSGEVRRQVIPMVCAKNERSQLDFGERSMDGDQTHGLWNGAATEDGAQIHMKLGSLKHVAVPYPCLQKALKTKKHFFVIQLASWPSLT